MRSLLRKLRYSLAARLMLLFLITGLLIVAILRITMWVALKHQFDKNIQPHIVQYLDYLNQDLGSPPDINKASALASRVPMDIYIRGPRVNWSSATASLELAEIQFRRHRNWQGRQFAVGKQERNFVLKTQNGDHTVFLVIQGRAGSAHGAWIGLSAVLAALLVLYLSYRTIRWLFQPVQEIQKGVQRIGQGELDHRIETHRKDELGDLVASINNMADDIEKMLEAKRQMLLAISHELRSPITRARVSTELLEESTTKQRISADLHDMESLITELLEIERLNTRHNVLNRTVVSMNELVIEVISENFSANKININLAENDPYVRLDGTRIKLLIKNLLDNAIKYNRDQIARPEFEIDNDKDHLILRVRDYGAGIAAEHLQHLTEPFYRADPSRQRETGGYGLGLYLCRVIAEAHGGKLSIASDLNEGTHVEVNLPIKA